METGMELPSGVCCNDCAGSVAWCGSARCTQLHDWATHEPHFQIWMDPTPMQRVLAVIPCMWFRLLLALFPGRWILPAIDARKGWRYVFIIWAWGSGYFWTERREGRI